VEDMASSRKEEVSIRLGEDITRTAEATIQTAASMIISRREAALIRKMALKIIQWQEMNRAGMSLSLPASQL